jgi:hypothetical protein
MLLHEATIKANLPATIKFIDPALYTFDEYKVIAGNKSDNEDIYHSDGAYSVSLDKLNEHESFSDYTRLMANITKKGLSFTVKAQVIDYMKANWMKYDENGYPVQIDGEYQQLTAEERKLALTGKNQYSYYFAIFNEDNKCVGATQDEWGALLVRVANEYKGFGFGPYLVGLQRKYFPKANSGGFTVPGINNLLKVHTLFVKDYLASGKYSQLVREKKLTIDQVKEITKHITKLPTKSNISFNEKKMFTGKIEVFHAGDTGEWIIYDQAISTMIDDDKLSYWTEKALLAAHYNEIIENHDGTYVMVRFGTYKNDKFKLQLLKMACSWDVAYNNVSIFRIKNTDIPSILNLFENIEVFDSQSVLASFKKEYLMPLSTIKLMIAAENNFRKTFDQYEEFKSILHELGASYVE